LAEKKERQTKRKVDLTSSHSNNDNDNDIDGPLAAYTLEGSAISDLYKDRDTIPSFIRYFPKQGEQLIEEDVYIPDVD
jgi:hypothetical protein